MNKFFKLEEKGTTVRTEVIAGITTFMAMAYILVVNPGMFSALSESSGITFGAIYVATAISAFIGTILIGLLANLPLAQASGMGLNAFFVYTVCLGLGFTYANSLIFVLADGVIFIILTVTGLRKIIFDAIPKTVKTAIPAGIGLFIAFIGLQDAKLVVKDDSTCVKLNSFNLLGDGKLVDKLANIAPLIITIITLFLIASLSKRKVKGSILISVLSGSVLYYIASAVIPGFGIDIKTVFTDNAKSPIGAIKDFGKLSFGKVFTEGFDFSTYLANHSQVTLVIIFITTALAFCLVDMFDTMGTLYGACRGGNMLVKNDKGEEEVPNMNRAMLADAIATCTGAVCGTSTVTTYVESSAGVAEGGRTGLSAMVTGALFLVSMFFAPLASLIPASAYAAALIYVGILMIGCVKDIDWSDPCLALPAFLTMAMMPFTYNISYGIAFGLLSYIAINAFRKDRQKVNIGTLFIGMLFVAMFFLTH